MSNSPTPTRFLRRQGDSFQVIINTHVEPTTDEEREYGPVRVTGRRPLDEPVATIQPSVRSDVRSGSSIYQVFDAQGAYLASGNDPVALAKRLADGEFDNDFRFEITTNPEPDDPGSTHFLVQYSVPSQREMIHLTTGDPYGFIEAARERQAVPDLEDRLALYAEREDREREAAR